MLLFTISLGGLQIMMGQHDRSEALFYYFRLEDQVPETHRLRLIEKHISFAFVREPRKDRYSERGRLSIDPELLLRIRDSAPLHVLEESARKIPGVEAVRATVSRDRGSRS
jgi:transposase